MIERKIIIGLITSTPYITKVRPVWDSMLLESSTGRQIANWAIKHFDEYGKCMGKEFETVFYQKVNEGAINKDEAEEFEEDILPDLSEEFEEDNGVDLDYLLPETLKYLKERQYHNLSNQLQNTLESGTGDMETRIQDAKEIQESFTPLSLEKDEPLDLSSKKAQRSMRRAFTQLAKPVIKFAKQLGKFWNEQFVPGAFVMFLAPEKRGKSWLLLAIALIAVRQGKKVLMFQAGDMSEHEQLRRMGVSLSKSSYLEKYCGEYFRTIRDCKRNLNGSCNNESREGFSAPWEGCTDDELKTFTMYDYKECYENYGDHTPCYHCDEYDAKKLGAPWLEKVKATIPLKPKEAVNAMESFFNKYKGGFQLSTHPNGTLTTKDIERTRKQLSDKGWDADLILVDYLELLDGKGANEREKQNNIAKSLRKVSQTKLNDILPVVIAPTQADAKAYTVDLLKLDNFSEDKRKFAHVTAMYGLNQDKNGVEKSLGLMRINELVLREGDFSINNHVTVLMDLSKGRPFRQCYFS